MSLSRPQVRHTADFDRVVALPRRVPQQYEAEAWAAVLTPQLRQPLSTAELRPWQAYGLAELAEAPPGRGVVMWLTVGTGKTLPLALAPVMVNAKRTLYIVPASLEAKTDDDFRKLREHWKLSNEPYRIITREILGQPRGAELLNEYAPDLICLEESDEFANADSSAVRRIDRYVVENEHVRVVNVTGTPSRKSIMGYWHIICWCLREGAPVPLDHADAELWAQAIDETSSGPRRAGPGPLGEDRKKAIDWYRKRLLQTPGMVSVDGDSCTAPLEISTRLAKEDPILDEHYKIFLEEQRNPGGIEVTDPLSRWKLDGFLGCGLYTRYIEPPPDEWLAARRAFAKFVRNAIERSTRSHKPLDSESQVVRRFRDHPVVTTWLEAKKAFIPKTEAVWLTTSAIESCREWLEESSEPGIIWCGSVEFGQTLARALGLRYFGRKGKAADGAVLYNAPTGVSMVCSWNANKKGFNLQPWSRQLIVMPPQSAKWIEQIIGRSHRSGQNKTVYVDILLTSGGTIDLIETALREARFAKRTTSLTQKILRAKIARATPVITPSNEFRWATRSQGDISLVA